MMSRVIFTLYIVGNLGTMKGSFKVGEYKNIGICQQQGTAAVSRYEKQGYKVTFNCIRKQKKF